MKFYIYTLGCKVNSYESMAIEEALLNYGYQIDDKNPDIVIVNTCSVTNAADAKSLKMVRHFKKLHPDAILVVCGCSSENKESEYHDIGIDIVVGNNEKSEIPNLIEEYLSNHKDIVKVDKKRHRPFMDMQVKNFDHTRAFIKIQDGCDNFCTYCIIPYLRGSIRSKKMEDVVTEATNLVNSGHKEIVLTGIHTGSYGNDLPYDLTDLIKELSKIDGLEGIRISSIEVTELNDKFLEELKINKKIVNHLHIPLQAGSNEILKAMNRKYDLDKYEEIIKKVREARKGIAITTDVIVGFPGETEELFNTTIETCKRINYAKIHVFPFSERKGTIAATLPNKVSCMEKKERARRLIEVSDELEHEYYKKFLDKDISLLVETSGDISVGTTSNYLKVKVDAKLNRGEVYTVHTYKLVGNVLLAHVINN